MWVYVSVCMYVPALDISHWNGYQLCAWYWYCWLAVLNDNIRYGERMDGMNLSYPNVDTCRKVYDRYHRYSMILVLPNELINTGSLSFTTILLYSLFITWIYVIGSPQHYYLYHFMQSLSCVCSCIFINYSGHTHVELIPVTVAWAFNPWYTLNQFSSVQSLKAVGK